jgi:radical SAM protein with 4Fe4S-binding SPASM domain
MDRTHFAEFVASTREYIFIRPEDNLLILRPNKVHHLNATATAMLRDLYAADPLDPAVLDALLAGFAARFGAPVEQIERDLGALLDSLQCLLRDEPGLGPAVRRMPFGSHTIKLPVLSEIALTYRCNNRCTFCYASAPDRGRQVPEMSTAQVKQVIDKIVDQAKAPTVSFTGGEPTLRPDLPELVAYARSRGLRVNLITNGILCAGADYVESLREAGLHSAQVSLEAADPDVHNRIVGNPDAWARTVQGLRNLKAAGIHTHTNTTINRLNRDHLEGLIDMLADMGQQYLSMNMVIRTGGGAAGCTGGEDDEIGYTSIGELVLRLKKHTESRDMRFVWYSPVPYCLFNPAQHGLGAQSCGAADGLLSINPAGEVLPCSSFEQGLGSLLHLDFQEVWQTRAAKYWRRKEFLPPLCKGCDLADLCCGACPLYWDSVGDFVELAGRGRESVPAVEQAVWRAKRRWIGQSKGVGLR